MLLVAFLQATMYAPLASLLASLYCPAWRWLGTRLAVGKFSNKFTFLLIRTARYFLQSTLEEKLATFQGSPSQHFPLLRGKSREKWLQYDPFLCLKSLSMCV